MWLRVKKRDQNITSTPEDLNIFQELCNKLNINLLVKEKSTHISHSNENTDIEDNNLGGGHKPS